MSFSGIQQTGIKRYSRWVLVLFVVSWINLLVQAPVHASMKQQAALSDHAGMVHCHCSETLCDTVLNLEDQSAEVVHFIPDDVQGFQVAYAVVTVDSYQQVLTGLYFRYLNSPFEVTRPPPLDITRILLI